MQAISDTVFQLSSQFDGMFLLEMHDNDLAAIADIFITSHQQLSEESARYFWLAENGEITELKRRVHLVKPLWGYCGLSELQEKFQKMESFFSSNPTINDALIRLEEEKPFILEGLELIRQEAIKIQEYLKQ
jgi:hypothetical protein